MTLYDLSEDLRAIEAAMDEHAAANEGDVTGFDFSALECVQGEIDAKLLNVGAWIKNLRAESEAYKAEKANLDRKKKVADDKIKEIQPYITNFLERGRPLKDSRCALSWRKSSSVDIPKTLDAEDLGCRHPDLVRTSTAFDKTAIKEALKEGPLVVGVGEHCHEILMKRSINLQIK